MPCMRWSVPMLSWHSDVAITVREYNFPVRVGLAELCSGLLRGHFVADTAITRSSFTCSPLRNQML